MVWAINQFRPYLHGKKFDVYTDHEPLKGLIQFKDPRGRAARWVIALAEYDFELHYKPGRVNNDADGLSRLPLPVDNDAMEEVELDRPACLVQTRSQTSQRRNNPQSQRGLNPQVKACSNMHNMLATCSRVNNMLTPDNTTHNRLTTCKWMNSKKATHNSTRLTTWMSSKQAS